MSKIKIVDCDICGKNIDNRNIDYVDLCGDGKYRCDICEKIACGIESDSESDSESNSESYLECEYECEYCGQNDEPDYFVCNDGKPFKTDSGYLICDNCVNPDDTRDAPPVWAIDQILSLNDENSNLTKQNEKLKLENKKLIDELNSESLRLTGFEWGGFSPLATET